MIRLKILLVLILITVTMAIRVIIGITKKVLIIIIVIIRRFLHSVRPDGRQSRTSSSSRSPGTSSPCPEAMQFVRAANVRSLIKSFGSSNAYPEYSSL